MHRKQPPVKISEKSNTDYENIKNSELSILCGKNNSGKTFLLKKLTRELGQRSTYLGPNRYQNFNLLSNVHPDDNRTIEKYRQLSNTLSDGHGQNLDNSPINLQQGIAELDDNRRKILFEIIKDLLDSDIDIKSTIENNEMAQKYISVDGYNLSFTSSGFRLITSIITSLLDTDYDNFIIDEPELGISPEIQGIIVNFLYNKENRGKYFPHIKKIIVATHSPVFLDRKEIANNYRISKNDNEFIINKISNIQEINSLQFSLLGNRFETLFLPSIIVFVEGETDFKFLKKFVNKKFPNSAVSISFTGGDGGIKKNLHLLKNMLIDINKSPYGDRIFAVLDEKHTSGLQKDLEDMGLNKENIVIWSKNGIEFYYPIDIIKDIYGGSSNIKIEGDVVSANGINYKKNELVDIICDKLTGDEKYDEEFEEKFIKRLENILF